MVELVKPEPTVIVTVLGYLTITIPEPPFEPATPPPEPPPPPPVFAVPATEEGPEFTAPAPPPPSPPGF